MKRAIFIVIDGPNAAGKGVLIEKLQQLLKARGELVLTREPGGSALAEHLRPEIKSDRFSLTPWTNALLFNAMRADHLEKVVEPALARGASVLCDRYIHSTEVFQVALGRLGPAERRAIEAVHECMRKPDLTVLLLPPIDVLESRRMGRADASSDSFEAHGAAAELEAYLAIAKRVAGDPSYLVLAATGRETPAGLALRVQAALDRVAQGTIPEAA